MKLERQVGVTAVNDCQVNFIGRRYHDTIIVHRLAKVFV
jgi:hypothetical protein